MFCFYFQLTSGCVHGLLLSLCSGIISSRTWGNIWGAEGITWVCMYKALPSTLLQLSIYFLEKIYSWSWDALGVDIFRRFLIHLAKLKERKKAGVLSSFELFLLLKLLFFLVVPRDHYSVNDRCLELYYSNVIL